MSYQLPFLFLKLGLNSEAINSKYTITTSTITIKLGGGARKKAYKYILTVIFPLCNSSKPYCFCSYITNIRNITFNYFIPHLLFIHVKVMSSHTVVGLFSTKKKLKKNFLNTCCVSCSFLSRHLSANTYTSYKLLRQTDKQGNLTFHSIIFLGKQHIRMTEPTLTPVHNM